MQKGEKQRRRPMRTGIRIMDAFLAEEETYETQNEYGIDTEHDFHTTKYTPMTTLSDGDLNLSPSSLGCDKISTAEKRAGMPSRKWFWVPSFNPSRRMASTTRHFLFFLSRYVIPR